MCMAKYGKFDQASQTSDHTVLCWPKEYYLCDAFIIVIIMIKACIKLGNCINANVFHDSGYTLKVLSNNKCELN